MCVYTYIICSYISCISFSHKSSAPYVKCLVFPKKLNFLCNSILIYSSPVKLRISILNLDIGFVKHAHVSGSITEVFCKKGVLRNFAKFTRKHLC